MLGLAACGRRPSDGDLRGKNVLLVIVDTLRADHLGCYGYARRTSPRIDGLAAQSVVFEKAYSHSPWTMPSVASLFTSLEPKDHGIEDWKQPLDEKLLTLAEALRSHGYRTEGYVSHGVLSRLYQFDQGFDVYDSSVVAGKLPREISTAREVTDLALGALGKMPAGRPWLLWVHYFDPHDAYLPHPGFEFGGEPMDVYDGEIAYTDSHIGRLLDGLRGHGLLEPTIVLLLADHGEGFGEHGVLYHSSTLYDELLHVPAILRVPGVPPQRVSSVVAAMDLAPTLLTLLGLPIPEAFRGRPLHLAKGRFRAVDDRVVVGETHRFADLRSIRAGRFKLIVDRETGGRKLFDVIDDPGERRNQRKQHPEVVERLKAALEAHYASGSFSAPRKELPEDLEQGLRSLGYIE